MNPKFSLKVIKQGQTQKVHVVTPGAAPDGTNTAATVTLTNSTGSYDYYKQFDGLAANTTYTFSVWAKAGSTNKLNITLNDVATVNTIAGDAQYSLGNGWGLINHTFTTDSTGKVYVCLGATLSTENAPTLQTAGTVSIWGVELNLGSAPGNLTVANLTGDARVQANGFHKLYGFEVIDLSQSTAAQTLTVASADVNQLSDGDNAGNTAKQLWVKLDSGDAIKTTGFSSGLPTYGYYTHTESDGTTAYYDRKWTGTDNGQAVELYASFGQYAPGLTRASYSGSTVSLLFDESITGTTSTTAWAVSGNATTAASLSGTGNVNLGLTFGSTLSGIVTLTYSGSTLLDSAGQGLRYSKLVLGTSATETSGLDVSGTSTDTALFSNGGNDVLKGGGGNDLLVVSGTASTTLSGGAGADVFKWSQFSQGLTSITDFKVSEGDKLNLGDLLAGTGFNVANMANYLKLLAGSGNSAVLQVDTSGSSSFASPALSVTIANATGTGGTDDIVNTGLQALINQRVILT